MTLLDEKRWLNNRGYPFEGLTRTTSDDEAAHWSRDHRDIAKLLGRTLSTLSRSNHLAEHNAIHPHFGLPQRSTENATTHLADHTEIHSNIRPGPSPFVDLPGGTVTINPGASTIQNAIAGNGNNTKFRLTAGTYSITGNCFPKSGQEFWGEYGAIIDGTNWSDPDSTTIGFFEGAGGGSETDVKIINLTIRNMPAFAVRANAPGSGTGGAMRWEVRNCHIHDNRNGIRVGQEGKVIANLVENNIWDANNASPARRGGAYTQIRGHDTEWAYNEFGPGNGPEQKILISNNVTFHHNYVHSNYRDGIWFDAYQSNITIEDNVALNEPRAGIFYEVSGAAIIRRNFVEGNTGGGLGRPMFHSTSKDTEVFDNHFGNSDFRSFLMFVDEQRIATNDNGSGTANNFVVGAGNNNIHHNVIRTKNTAQSGWNVINSGNPNQYHSSHGNVFNNNLYLVPDTTGAHWVAVTSRTWSQWQGLGFDTNGSRQVG